MVKNKQKLGLKWYAMCVKFVLNKCSLGLSHSIQDSYEHVTIQASFWEGLSSSSGAREQNFLGS